MAGDHGGPRQGCTIRKEFLHQEETLTGELKGVSRKSLDGRGTAWWR